jgi:hypothetical protein
MPVTGNSGCAEMFDFRYGNCFAGSPEREAVLIVL